jgi:hypothetical protein
MFITNMQRPRMAQMPRFGNNLEQEIPISQETNEKLQQIASKYGRKLEQAQAEYRSIKSLPALKELPEGKILIMVDSALDPSEYAVTLAVGENGYQEPEAITMALDETGFQDPERVKTQAMIPSEMGWNK